MYAVIVTFNLKSNAMAAFLPLILANAATSRRLEAGCHQFDVCTDPARPYTVLLYELYADRAAFDLHLGSEHFRKFDQAVGPMIASKEVCTFPEVRQ